jgi:formate hydrogenlyase subunit 3/multisubunit Na+/H+ antiporter MnhD subunit
MLFFLFAKSSFPDLNKSDYLSTTARSINFDVKDTRFVILSYIFLFLIYYLMIAPLLYSPGKEKARGETMPSSYMIPILTIFVSSIYVFLAKDLLFLFVAVEILSFCSYVLLMRRGYRGEIVSQRAVFQYLLITAFSSLLFFISIILSYSFAASTKFDTILINIIGYDLLYKQKSLLMIIAVICFTVSFLIKLGAPIFSFWIPQLYRSLDTKNLFLIAILIKLPILFAFEKTLISVYDNYSQIWSHFLMIVLIVGAISMAVVAMRQKLTLQELIIYSSISTLIPVLLPMTRIMFVSVKLSLMYYIPYLLASGLLLFSIDSASNDIALLKLKAEKLKEYFVRVIPRLGFFISLFLLSGFPLSILWFAKIEIFNYIEKPYLKLLIVLSTSLVFLLYMPFAYALIPGRALQHKGLSYRELLVLFLILVNLFLVVTFNTYVGALNNLQIVI